METRDLLQKNNFRYKKSLGQNFITDTALLQAIVRDAGVTADDIVIEIGAGAGTLTRALSAVAKTVYAFDVDDDLQPILDEALSDCQNVFTVFKDVLKMTDSEIKEIVNTPFKVVANLPYYITTPLIMRFMESTLPVLSLTVMVQKEVADRLCAKADTPEYGAITLAVAARGDARVMRGVSRKLFFPPPNVDSAVVRIDVKSRPEIKDINKLSRLIKAGFAMRRKTFVNNITAAFPISRETAKDTLISLGYNENVRGEALALEDYIKISDKLFY